jgi:hypothetical protein
MAIVVGAGCFGGWTRQDSHDEMVCGREDYKQERRIEKKTRRCDKLNWARIASLPYGAAIKISGAFQTVG